MERDKGQSSARVVFGRVTYADSGALAAGVRVVAMDADLFFDDALGRATTTADGAFEISYGTEQFRDFVERAPDIYLEVFDEEEQLLASTRNATIREAGSSQEIHVQLPEDRARPPRIEVGGVRVDRGVFEALDAADLIELTRLAVHPDKQSKHAPLLHRLSPELAIEELEAQLCFTPLVQFLREAAASKRLPRDRRLELETILTGYDPDAAYATYTCPHFTITYQDSGIDQPPTDDTGADITMPGTGVVVGSTVAGNGVSDYIEKLCFWLENAYSIYVSPPFDLRNPAAGGRIPVNVTGTSPGSASGGSMTIGRELNDDLLAAVPTHELMHLVQELYRTAGTAGGWNPGITEGGAVLAEDVVFDTHNRYVVQATTSGTLAMPGISLKDASVQYYLALLLKYVSEQDSSRVNAADEPAIGVETYRALLERFDADGFTDGAFAAAITALPWHQSFYELAYLDAARLDEMSSETVLGNFWLACYLKDLGTAIPDRRFDFMEDEQDATWDSIFLGADTVGTLGSVALTSTTNLTSGGSITLSSGTAAVSPFAARFYRVNVDPGVDTFRIQFSAGSGFAKPLVQVVLLESGGVVRDILRTDRSTWSRTIANARDGISLDHVLIVVAGTDSGGSFALSVATAPPAPDVMMTRWHHRAGTHYEIDSFGWAWTWVSPDIWVDNDGNGLADDEVHLSQDNALFIRLRNQGHADASGIGVQFWYQDASGGLSDAAWQPVRDAAGAVRSLAGLPLAAGAVDQWSVNWAPTPSGTSHHFCVRAVVTVPGDPNTDNKRCLSNFGNVIAAPYADVSLVRRLPHGIEDFRVDVIPRAMGRWFVSTSDVEQANRTPVAQGGEQIDAFRIRRRAKIEMIPEDVEHAHVEPDFRVKRPCPGLEHATRVERRPDPLGNYPTDPSALPPGLEDVALITVAHVLDGKAVGGFTWAIREHEK
jgi:hypothetical protein